MLLFEKTPNVCYEFTCPCGSNYVGHTDREVIKRIEEHQQKSKGKELFWHIQFCPEFIEKRNLLTPEETTKKKPTVKQKNFAFFKSRFKILQKALGQILSEGKRKRFIYV